MKKFVELTVQFKFVWGLFFAASMIIYATVGLLLGSRTMDLVVVWQMAFVTILLTFYHYLFFGELILNSLSIKYKVLIHSVLCYVSLFLSISLFNWFDISNASSIILYTGGYLIIYLGCIGSFYAYYKATGEELNNRLTAYKAKKSNN